MDSRGPRLAMKSEGVDDHPDRIHPSLETFGNESSQRAGDSGEGERESARGFSPNWRKRVMAFRPVVLPASHGTRGGWQINS